jgi:hypothetical protein
MTKRWRSGEKRRPTGDYRVGKYRPPLESRWKPGQSGNPKGRPKGRKNSVTMLRETLDRKLKVPIDGRVRAVSMRELMLIRLVDAALKGDVKIISFLLERDDAAETEHPPQGPQSTSEDHEIIDTFFKSHLNKHKDGR